MDAMERRVFLKGAGMGMLAFTVGGASVLMTPEQARTQGVPFRLLKASEARSGRRFAALPTTDQRDFVDLMRQNKIEGWQGPAGGFVYLVLRSDAVDVVYGTMDGYQSLGVPYMPHIAPEKRW